MPNKAKVLHIITRLDKGGSAENTFLTVKGLDKEKYDVTLMSGPVEDARQERRTQVEEYGIRYIHLPVLVRNIHMVYDLIALFKIYRFLAKEKFDVVHTHTSPCGPHAARPHLLWLFPPVENEDVHPTRKNRQPDDQQNCGVD